MTFRPRGRSVTFTALARLLTPRSIACRDLSPYVTLLAIYARLQVDPKSAQGQSVVRCRQEVVAGRGFPAGRLDREHVVFLHHQVLDRVERDGLTGILAERHGVADGDIQGSAHTVVEPADAGGQDVPCCDFSLAESGITMVRGNESEFSMRATTMPS